MKKTILICLIFFISVSKAFAVDCDDPITQSAMNYCTEKLYKEVDKELNIVYQKILKCTSEEHTKLLKNSQNLWIKYRDADCEFRSFEFRTGSIFPMWISGCLVDKTKARIKELKAIAESPLEWGIVCPKSNKDCNLPKEWQKLCPILEARLEQTAKKMKLQKSNAKSLEQFLNSTDYNFIYLAELQNFLPKITLELLIAINERGLDKTEADLMAKYLQGLMESYNFQNIAAFDENTSHIIGRQWHEIDYSGEGMTWQRQKAKYTRYEIVDFKSVDCLKKFFAVESKLPYFTKIYRPQMLKMHSTPHGNAGCIIKKDNFILVVKTLNSGKYTIPCGKPEGEEVAYKTAERETLEETGLQVKAVKLLEDFSGRFYMYECHIIDKNFTLSHDNLFKVPTKAINEISEVRFIDIDKLTLENVRFPSALPQIKEIFKNLP